ncbi:DUF7518 family protein [Haloarcula onubensis]|uniref:BZIP transcription factor n=1 Tax=Haloarcula onubensis TaxID=2950539 RepID=A0ABU2FJY6_9EURY|nr:hypothetical protein [Halomicroarcula sp. S3CR25-11]MDS0281068.1 hypothetical protein [Halomicroarcula sp. S3CR25-11]
MCGNRVEELEEQVQQLQASVEGLTDELVECKVRIRELENTVDDESGFSRSAPADSEATEAEAEVEADASEESTESEILVPEAGTSNTEAPEETDNTADTEADAESETDDDAGSDIIVA